MPLSDAQIDQVIETLETATEENNVSSLRSGQVVNLPAEGEIWITGDLHDHRRNFEKFVVAADLANNPQRHIILHELIHGDHFDENRAEDSWQMLFWVADLKCAFSSQVHFLLANHDLAQIHGEGIMKAGLSVCEAFNAGVKRDFGSRRAAAHVAITEMLLSFPLAIRTQNGLFVSHSIPTDDQIPNFDYGVFDRALTGEDYRRRTGAVYQLVWGRKMSAESASAFADKVSARILINGHQPQEFGFTVNGDRQIVIASDHNQGVFLPLSLSENYDIEGIVERVRRFVSLPMPDQAEQVEAVANLDVDEEGAGGEMPVFHIDPAPVVQEQEAVRESITEPDEMTPGVIADPLPDDGARTADPFLAAVRDAFAEIRALCSEGQSERAAELAAIFQTLPGEAESDRAEFRNALRAYERKYMMPDAKYSARFQPLADLTPDEADAS